MAKRKRTNPRGIPPWRFQFLVRAGFSLRHTFDVQDVRKVRSSVPGTFAPTELAVYLLQEDLRELVAYEFPIESFYAYCKPRPAPKRCDFLVRGVFDVQRSLGRDEVERVPSRRRYAFRPTDETLAWLEERFVALLHGYGQFDKIDLAAYSSPHLLIAADQEEPPNEEVYWLNGWGDRRLCQLFKHSSAQAAVMSVRRFLMRCRGRRP